MSARFSILLLAVSILCFGCEDLAPGLASSQELVLRGERSESRFGTAVAFLGDINGDGFSDVGVGAPGDNRGGENAGSVSIYFGSASGPADAPHAVLLGHMGDRFGSHLAEIGDVNADGLEDFAVSASGLSRLGYSNRGVVLVFFGHSQGLLRAENEIEDGVRFSETADLLILGPAVEGEGEAPIVSSAGDLDQNGALDLALGFPAQNQVSIFLNGAPFPSATRITTEEANITISGEASRAGLGASMAAVGDVNGENHGLSSRFGDDLALGACRPGEKGAVYLILGQAGRARGLMPVRSLASSVFEGHKDRDEFGTSVAGIGDFDGNGFGDIAIGAPGHDAGRVEIYFGLSFLGPRAEAPAQLFGENTGDRFGASLSGALDVPIMDRRPVIVGAPMNDFLGTDSGSVYFFTNALFMGKEVPRGAQANASFADFRIRNPLGRTGNAEHFGTVVIGGCDVNADGSGDLLVGIPGAETAGVNAGAAFLQW